MTLWRGLGPSRTFTVALAGLAVLAGLGAVLGVALVWGLAAGPAELPGQALAALQVVSGCVATVATGGAGAMAARDWSSRGLTSSQGAQVLAAHRARLPADAPQATNRGAVEPGAPPPPAEPEHLGDP